LRFQMGFAFERLWRESRHMGPSTAAAAVTV
jgi:hypothetical protein